VFLLASQTERAPSPANAAAVAPSRARRELMIFVILLACGLFLMPLLIWVVGRSALGPYTDGGPFALLVDFFSGLKSGSPVYWCVALGPYVLVMILRGCWHFMRAPKRESD
jgi:hypothetical protein